MNFTSTPKINFFKATRPPGVNKTQQRAGGRVGSSFYTIDPDIVNQQRTRTGPGIRDSIKGGAKGAAFGAGYTVATMENVVKGMVASIFRRQAERNKAKESRQRTKAQPDQVTTLVPAINANTLAVNNLGSTLNSIGVSLSNLLKVDQARYNQERKAALQSDSKFGKREKVKTARALNIGDAILGPIKGFWEALSGLIGDLLKYLFVRPILEWIANPDNQEKLKSILTTMKKVFDFIYSFTKGRIVGIIDGLAVAFDGEKSLRERLGGLFGALGNLGLLLLGIRWLSNPLNIIKDLGAVLGAFKSGLGLMLKFISVPFKLAAATLSLPFRALAAGAGFATRNPLTAIALGVGGLAVGAAVKNKYDNDPEFQAFVQEKYGDISEFTQEQFTRVATEWNKRVEQGREFLRGDQETIAENLADEAQELREGIAGQFNRLTGDDSQVSQPQIAPIGPGQSGENYIEQYLQRAQEFQESTVEAIRELSGNQKQNFNLTEQVTEQLNNLGENLQELNPLNSLPERSMGGLIPTFSKGGGYIKGPKSGYPVSLDGGKTPSFIGHGTEYVSKRNDGSAFVIPIDTPHTDRDPNLQIKRTNEALAGGYNLKQMSEGGAFNLLKPSTWGSPFHAPVGTPTNPFRFETPALPKVDPANPYGGLLKTVNENPSLKGYFAPPAVDPPVVTPPAITPPVVTPPVSTPAPPAYTPATDSRNAEYIKARSAIKKPWDYKESSDARSIGIKAWAKANPELAKKLKPGDVGYDILNPAPKSRPLVPDSAPATGQDALDKLRNFTGQPAPTQPKKPGFFDRIKNFLGFGQQQQQQPQGQQQQQQKKPNWFQRTVNWLTGGGQQPQQQRRQQQQRQVPWSQLPPDLQRKIPPPIWADQPVNLPTRTFVPRTEGQRTPGIVPERQPTRPFIFQPPSGGQRTPGIVPQIQKSAGDIIQDLRSKFQRKEISASEFRRLAEEVQRGEYNSQTGLPSSEQRRLFAKQQYERLLQQIYGGNLNPYAKQNAFTETVTPEQYEKLSPRQKFLLKRRSLITDPRMMQEFTYRYGGRTPGILTDPNRPGDWRLRMLLGKEFEDGRFIGPSKIGADDLIRKFINFDGFSKGGKHKEEKGYLPKMEGPQIRMREGKHKVQHLPQGGWVTGPMSGYPVSIKGRGRPDFIAHGTEYVSKKPTGEFAVLPYHGLGGKVAKSNIISAAAEGFHVPKKRPGAQDFKHPGQTASVVHNGKEGFFLGGLVKGIGDAIGGIFGGGGDSGGGGGGNFISNAISGIGNFVGGLFGGGQQQTPAPIANVGNMFGQDLGLPSFGDMGSFDVGDIFGGNSAPSFQMPWLDNITDTLGIGNIYGQPENTNPFAKLNPMTQASIAQGQKWGFTYNDDGTIQGKSIFPGLMRQAGGLGKELGKIFGGEDGSKTGSAIGNTLFTIFGGGGSGPEGAATPGDILSSAAGLASFFLKDKKGVLGKVGRYGNILFGPGSEQFTFGEKVALALNDALHGTKYGKWVRPIASALGVDVANSVAYAKMLNGEGLAGPNAGLAAAAGEVPGGPSGGLGPGAGQSLGGSDIAMPGGGIKASIATGKSILNQGFSVFNHPNFRNNKWSEYTANTGKGFVQGGGEKVTGEKHALGLGIDVGDFRPDGGGSRLQSLAAEMFSRKVDNKLTQVTFDPWGSWIVGGKREGPGKFGYPDQLHLGFAKEERASAGSSLGPVQGGVDEMQQAAISQAVSDQAPSGASTLDMANMINAITNNASEDGGDLASVLNGQFNMPDAFGLATKFDTSKTSQAFEGNEGASIFDTSFDMGGEFNLAPDSWNFDVEKLAPAWNLGTNTESLYNANLATTGGDTQTAEQIVNSTNFMPFGGGLKFTSENNSQYNAKRPDVVLPEPLTSPGGGGTKPMSLMSADAVLGKSGKSYASIASSDLSGGGFAQQERRGPNKIPFFGGGEDAPASKRGSAANVSGLRDGNDLFGSGPPGGTAANQPDQGEGDLDDTSNISKGPQQMQQSAVQQNAQAAAFKERQYGQERINEQSSRMVQQTLARVEAINAQVRNDVANAAASVAKMQGSGGGASNSEQLASIGTIASNIGGLNA